MPKGFRKVDTIRHKKLQVEVPLRLDFSTMEFHAEYAGRKFTGKDGDQVTKDVIAHIEKESAITWEPVIQVKDVSHRIVERAKEGPDLRSTGVAVEIRRFWLGRISSGRILHADWGWKEEDRYARAKELKAKPRETRSLDERRMRRREGVSLREGRGTAA